MTLHGQDAGAGEIRDVVARALAEDVGSGDWTTLWTIDADARGVARITAKAPLVLAGTDVAEEVFRQLDSSVEVERLVTDGTALEPGTSALRIEGPTRVLLTGERVALNFLGHLSGIATLTRRFVEAIAGTSARVVDTRKTTPGLRALEKRAVRAGGGENHRMGLHDMVLVKDNHIDAAGGVVAAVERVQASNAAGLPVEVEVRTLTELGELLPLGVDRVLLDNMPLGILRQAVEMARSLRDATLELEASGNVDLSTVRAVAECGVDLVSVGALTHSAPSVDLSMRIET